MKNDLQAAGVSGTALDTIDAAIATLDRLQQAVDSAKTDVSTISTTTADARTKINEELANAKKDITEMNSSLEETLKQQTANLASDPFSAQVVERGAERFAHRNIQQPFRHSEQPLIQHGSASKLPR